MSDRTRLDYGRQAEAWESSTDPVISFVCLDSAGEEEVWSFPFFHLTVGKCKGELLSLQWGQTLVLVEGPKARAFHREFVKGKATWLKADGEGITSIQVLQPKANESQPACG